MEHSSSAYKLILLKKMIEEFQIEQAYLGIKPEPFLWALFWE